MRQIILDTETTGLDPKNGHRVIEIGCVEMVNRQMTDRTFHVYLNPDRKIDDEAIAVHGITDEFLRDKPNFEGVFEEFVDFVRDAEVIAHNAPFDVGFLDAELARIPGASKMSELMAGGVAIDTLALAREKRPGKRNSLDALCRDFKIDSSERTLHGALLDAELLTLVYLAMTREQSSMFNQSNTKNHGSRFEPIQKMVGLNRTAVLIRPTQIEEQNHLALIEEMRKKGATPRWDEIE
ncbi:DNA polymerase III subunit epsilon [Litorivicinus sp.]|jgi:DNA polymerase-3 subunit epsilon|nr:DNA polymerase III subunit epsilon [Litorivicinus sp.]|tara:strand:+ start:17029 stop:17742 length:714 start_codon:yes stop_codon:yes gene_type:complete